MMWAFWARNTKDDLVTNVRVQTGFFIMFCNERRQIHPNIPILWRIGAIRATRRSSWAGARFGGRTKLMEDMTFSPSSIKTFVFSNHSHACADAVMPVPMLGKAFWHITRGLNWWPRRHHKQDGFGTVPRQTWHMLQGKSVLPRNTGSPCSHKQIHKASSYCNLAFGQI